MTTTTEVAPGIFRLCTYVPDINLQFSQFLVRDDEPLLFHTGPRAMFPAVRDAIAELIDPTDLRWIGFSHYESDECGGLNQFLELAPNAEPLCALVGALVSINDIALRPARGLQHHETFSTGQFQFQFQHTPHLPHCWEAGALFEQTTRTLFCSDLFHQNGDVEALTESDVVGRMKQMLDEYEQGPLAHYMPYTHDTDRMIQGLADLDPAVCATMHGSVYAGDGAQALRDMAVMMRETLGPR